MKFHLDYFQISFHLISERKGKYVANIVNPLSCQSQNQKEIQKKRNRNRKRPRKKDYDYSVRSQILRKMARMQLIINNEQ